MDIHIDKKIAGLMAFAFVIGILIGAMIGMHHSRYGRDFGRNHMYFLDQDRGASFGVGGMRGNVQYFDDEAAPPMMQALPGTTGAPAPVNTK